MNITLDDTSGQILYSSGQWSVQGPNDVIAPQYFDKTYHVTQDNGATITLEFQGTAAYIFGSKGPGHSNFSVRWDVSIEPLSAWAPTFQSKQLLWSRIFPADGSEGGGPGGNGTHTILLFTQQNGTNNWLDIDYVTFTVTTGSTLTDSGTLPSTNGDVLSSIATSTILSGPQSSSPLNSTAPASPASSSGVSPTLITTIILGVLLIALVCVFFVFRHLRRKSSAREARERNFRYRPTTQTPTPSTLAALDIAGRDHPHTHTISPYGRSTATTPVMAPLSAVTNDTHPLVSMRGGDHYTADVMRDAYNRSAMGSSARSASTVVDIARVGSPESASKASAVTGSNADYSNYTESISRGGAPSIKPPSYTAPYHHHHPAAQNRYWPSQPFEHISEVDSTESNSMPASPNPVNAAFGPTDPLRIPVNRSSIAKRPMPVPVATATANLVRIAPPNRVKPPKRPPREEVALYDDGDSRRTNFLQV